MVALFIVANFNGSTVLAVPITFAMDTAGCAILYTTEEHKSALRVQSHLISARRSGEVGALSGRLIIVVDCIIRSCTVICNHISQTVFQLLVLFH